MGAVGSFQVTAFVGDRLACIRDVSDNIGQGVLCGTDKDERKRVTLKSFDDCLQEKTMVELCQSFAELSLKD